MTAPRRDPARSLRAIAAGTLGIEAVVLGLALVAIHGLHPDAPGTHLAAIGALIALCVVVAAGQRSRLGPAAGAVLQLLVVAAGLLAWPLYALGVIFGLLWFAYLRLRRALPPGRYADPP